MENISNNHSRKTQSLDSKKKSSKLYDKFLSLDLFGESFQLKVDPEGDQQAQPSITGSICTILFVLVILSYTGQKLEFLIYRKGVDIITNVKESHFDESFTFTPQ